MKIFSIIPKERSASRVSHDENCKAIVETLTILAKYRICLLSYSRALSLEQSINSDSICKPTMECLYKSTD